MSETKNPDVIQTSDVLETVETVETVVEAVEQTVEQTEEPAAVEPEQVDEPDAEAAQEEEKGVVGEIVEDVLDVVDKTLDELVEMFRSIGNDVDRMKKSKEVETIKSAFYKRLLKEKGEESETVQEETPQEQVSKPSPFAAVETEFKSLYNDYKRERAEYNKQLDKEREENLAAKNAVIEELKALVEKQEDVNATFPAFREIQNKWKSIGPVPAPSLRNVNDTYHFYVEKFYDMVKINRDLRDLDFKKNLEAKIAFCEAAEKLAENENIVEAFHELQKFHDQWKEFGPVAKEFREDIWNRFKAATAVINKRYQAHFEDIKAEQVENRKAKEELCVRLEEIADKEIKGSEEWNTLSKAIEEIQKQWKGIGYASKKDNQKLYERFRAACDKFFDRKKAFYMQYKDTMTENLEKKMSIIEAAEALKTSTEWKKATDQFINLQKQWKEIGAVPRKKSEQLWKRFRAACDEFFAERDKNAKPENDYYANLKAKKAVIAEIKAYEAGADEEADREALNKFNERWQSIGFVPFKEKDAVAAAFKEAVSEKFGNLAGRVRNAGRTVVKAVKSEKEILIQKYNALQQDIDTYENNIGFFAKSKNSESLINQMRAKIDESKEELKKLKELIRKEEQAEAEQE